MAISVLPLTQGDTWDATFRFSQGALLNLVSLVGTTITTEIDHCFKVGDVLHLGVIDQCEQSHFACVEVVGVGSNTIDFALLCGQFADGECGYVVKAIDLTSFSLFGAVATRPLSASSPCLSGCVAIGGNQILIEGDAGLRPGDVLCFDAAGLIDVTVQSVKPVCLPSEEEPEEETEEPETEEPVNGKVACGWCDDNSSSSTETEADTTTEETEPTVTHTLVSVSGSATANIACDALAQITLKPKTLAKISFREICDKKCGVMAATIGNTEFNSVPVAADGCSGAQEIGCYQIVLAQGCPSPRAGYPNYINWAKTIAQGPAYLKPGLICSFFDLAA